MHGYYCQKCPAGAEPSPHPIGCFACKPGCYKAEAGNGACQPYKNAAADYADADYDDADYADADYADADYADADHADADYADADYADADYADAEYAN